MRLRLDGELLVQAVQRDDLAAQIDDALHVVRNLRHTCNRLNSYDFNDNTDINPIDFLPQPEGQVFILLRVFFLRCELFLLCHNPPPLL